jgi:hypothetical protein
MKIIDTFLYNGDVIAPFHIKYLYDTVDEFIIIESWETHSGTRKDTLFFNIFKKDFEPYMKKITYLLIDTFPNNISNEWKPEIWMINKTYSSWYRENYHRDFVINYLQTNHSSEKYVLYCGDVDEIPNKDVLQALRNNDLEFNNIIENDIIYLEMTFFYYNFQWKKFYNWYHPFITTHIFINKQNPYQQTLSKIRTLKGTNPKYIKNAGWHCSFFMGYQDIKRKIESFAHLEYNLDSYKNEEIIFECINHGKDIFSRGIMEDLIKCPIEDASYSMTLPIGWEDIQCKLKLLQN